ncbi:MAG: malonic semialdehyde reductase [Planctomycetes bacterium]|nr:malonic semialdehyde reductase [Planctomycetota bacterium]
MPNIPQTALDQLFFNARTHNAWLDKPVSDATLRELFNAMRWAPTSANCSPLRVVFVKSPAAKAKLLTCVAPGNQEKTKAAPVTAILAQDMEFFEKLPKLFPAADARSWFVGNEKMIADSAFRNSSIQGGYFILAARAMGLDCGPMSGFDNAAADKLFFAGTKHRSNFLCNLGYGDAGKLFPRSPRLEFDEACTII